MFTVQIYFIPIKNETAIIEKISVLLVEQIYNEIIPTHIYRLK